MNVSLRSLILSLFTFLMVISLLNFTCLTKMKKKKIQEGIYFSSSEEGFNR